ncbi:hypothetical protein NDU88_004856 [Pleurodeles waltl]|uniref:Uncharacterized protein n=1 Tax=Pleurodeles waltl TaxID=8319 RepID=A0AAV7TSM6_PLEWA|nr:hypothetical protein NDU88_004856 [Pleurodeles waltl]
MLGGRQRSKDFQESAPGIGAGRPRSSWTQKNGRLKRTPTPETKKPLLGGAERRRSRSRQKSLKTTADPGELCERAATLQEKLGHSRWVWRGSALRASGSAGYCIQFFYAPPCVPQKTKDTRDGIQRSPPPEAATLEVSSVPDVVSSISAPREHIRCSSRRRVPGVRLPLPVKRVMV